MQAELAVDEVEFRWRDQPAMRHAHAIERAVEVCLPELEEVGELGKARRHIIVLPDIALEQRLMIRKAVDNLSRGQRKSLDLAKESRVDHGTPLVTLLPRQQLNCAHDSGPDRFLRQISTLAADAAI